MEKKRRVRWVLRCIRAIFEILCRKLLGMLLLAVVGVMSIGDVDDDDVWMMWIEFQDVAPELL